MMFSRAELLQKVVSEKKKMVDLLKEKETVFENLGSELSAISDQIKNLSRGAWGQKRSMSSKIQTSEEELQSLRLLLDVLKEEERES